MLFYYAIIGHKEDTMSMCQVDGCDRRIYAGGYCRVHYTRVRRHGHPQANIPLRGERICKVIGCNEPHKALGYCKFHYKRHNLGIPLDKKRRRKEYQHKVCTVDGCNEPHHGLGYCSRHYQRFKRYGDPHKTKKTVYSKEIQELLIRYPLATVALMVLGRKCVRCGFDDIRALQIDHINNDGYKENRVKMYHKILRGDTEGYQVLCANCNWIKRYV